eukprot:1392713-Rhodomonas_salina.3
MQTEAGFSGWGSGPGCRNKQHRLCTPSTNGRMWYIVFVLAFVYWYGKFVRKCLACTGTQSPSSRKNPRDASKGIF